MEVSRTQQGPVATLGLKGPLVEEDLGALDRHVEECTTHGILRIILDIAGVPFIDSAGLEKIQEIVSRVSLRGGHVCIASPNDVCRDIVAATRMDSFVLVFPNRESAFRSLS
jgi:anti-anti-sigma factor